MAATRSSTATHSSVGVGQLLACRERSRPSGCRAALPSPRRWSRSAQREIFGARPSTALAAAATPPHQRMFLRQSPRSERSDRGARGSPRPALALPDQQPHLGVAESKAARGSPPGPSPPSRPRSGGGRGRSGASAGTALNDGDLQSTHDTVTVPLPRNSSVGRRRVRAPRCPDDRRHLVDRVDAALAVGAVGRDALGHHLDPHAAAVAAVDVEVGGLAEHHHVGAHPLALDQVQQAGSRRSPPRAPRRTRYRVTPAASRVRAACTAP